MKEIVSEKPTKKVETRKEDNMKLQPFDIQHMVRSVVALAAVAALMVIGFVTVNAYQHSREQELKNQAVHDCTVSSQFSYEETDKTTGKVTRSQEPIKSVYKTCMEDKGYVTVIKE